jgi:hypothetical protein
MLGGMFSSHASAMCFRTISEYKKRSPQMRQLPLVAGEDVRTSLGAFRIVFGIGHFSRSNPQGAICRFGRPFNSRWSSTSMAIGLTVPDKF